MGAHKNRELEGPNKEHKGQLSNRTRGLYNKPRDQLNNLHKDQHSNKLRDPKPVVAPRSKVHKGLQRDPNNLHKDPNKEVQPKVKDHNHNNLPEAIRKSQKKMVNNNTQDNSSLQ